MSSWVRARLVKLDDTVGNITDPATFECARPSKVPDLVERHGFDVEGVGSGADVPGVLGVVEVQRLGQSVGDHRAPRGEVGVGQDAADHVVVGVIGRTPAHQHVGVRVGGHFGECEVHDAGPGREGVAHRLELAGAGDVIGADVERKGEIAAVPCTGRGEVDAVAHVRQAAPRGRHRARGWRD